jgi:Ca2+-binding EF-hand superfamily protein
MLWDNNLSMTEKARREEYLKTKISEGFSLFYDKKKNFIEKKEVPYVMRYLGQFPSEAQVRDAILPEVNPITFRSKKTNPSNPSNTLNSNPTC